MIDPTAQAFIPGACIGHLQARDTSGAASPDDDEQLSTSTNTQASSLAPYRSNLASSPLTHHLPKQLHRGPKPLASSSAPPNTTPTRFDWTIAPKPTSLYPRNVQALQDLCAQKDEHIRHLKAALVEAQAIYAESSYPQPALDTGGAAWDASTSRMPVRAQMLDSSSYGKGFISCLAGQVPTLLLLKEWVSEKTRLEVGDVYTVLPGSDEAVVIVSGELEYRTRMEECKKAGGEFRIYVEEALALSSA